MVSSRLRRLRRFSTPLQVFARSIPRPQGSRIHGPKSGVWLWATSCTATKKMWQSRASTTWSKSSPSRGRTPQSGWSSLLDWRTGWVRSHHVNRYLASVNDPEVCCTSPPPNQNLISDCDSHLDMPRGRVRPAFKVLRCGLNADPIIRQGTQPHAQHLRHPNDLGAPADSNARSKSPDYDSVEELDVLCPVQQAWGLCSHSSEQFHHAPYQVLSACPS